MEWLLHRRACRASSLGLLVLPGTGTCISPSVTRKREGEEEIFSKHQEEQQRQFITKCSCLLHVHLTHTSRRQTGKQKGSTFLKFWESTQQSGTVPQGTVTHGGRALLCLCTNSHTHTTTTAKDWIIFCWFIQHKQRSTKQRLSSKTNTSQLTLQLQPNPHCHLRHLCCTRPKTKCKKKHHKGQSQHPVQSPGGI